MLQGKKILLIISGGIAAYKTLEFIRRAREQGASVRAILTSSGTAFVTPLSVASVTGEKVYQNLFDLTDEAEMGHIQLSRESDLILIAPATANLMARMVQGIADDLATTCLLATDTPVMIAPAMNVRMWQHPATQRNVKQLQQDGMRFVGPTEGDMACGEYGPGRMSEPADILKAVTAFFEGSNATQPVDTADVPPTPAPAVTPMPLQGTQQQSNLPLSGKRVLITAGPTHEPIDPVRFIANRSSGKQGFAIAKAIRELGAETYLVSGPVSLPTPEGVYVSRVETAREMLAACQRHKNIDVVICTAAVADWRAESEAGNKLKKDGKALPPLSLTENPDILKTLCSTNDRADLIIGFAAETENVVEYAKAKRARKQCDWIVANDVSPATGTMGGDSNTVHLITDDGVEDWDSMPKSDVAKALAWRIYEHFNDGNVTKADFKNTKGTKRG